MTQWDYKVIKALRGTGEMEHELKRLGASGWELVSAHWGAWMLSAYLKREIGATGSSASGAHWTDGSRRLAEDVPYGDAW